MSSGFEPSKQIDPLQDHGATASAPDAPVLTVIVPARNASATLADCLASVVAQADPDTEIIVLDDGSTDSTAEIAQRFPVRLIRLGEHRGVAAARNLGTHAARGSMLLFTDADVTLQDGALERGRAAMAASGVQALIGSYDDEPGYRSTVSLFKNLSHHYFHQRTGPYVTTFWGGCGFINREVLIAVGGFNEQRQGITDVELGYRLTARGIRIRLDPAVQVKHLKRWTLPLLLKTDLKVRAIPWTTLMLEFGYLPDGLNFTFDQRAGAMLACLLVASAIASVIWPQATGAFLLFLVLAAIINRRLFALFYRRGGLRLMVGGFLLQQLYYLYSIAGMIVGVARYWLGILPPAAGQQ
jgi:glycosyltransferase involved in cell wall biosynthesis